jgi:hypothetical protein
MDIKKYLHSDELSEWDTIFDPGGKQEYTEEQLIRFAELWSDKKLTYELEKIIDTSYKTVPLKVADRLDQLLNDKI